MPLRDAAPLGVKLTLGGGNTRLSVVSRFRRQLVAVFLAAFWLLATQHCGLEAAGLFDSHADIDHAACADPESHCGHDSCQIVEGGDYSPGAPTKVPSPQLAVCCPLPGALLAVPPREAETRYSPVGYEAPQDWITTWRFVQRAAALPRAPSSL